MFVDLGKMNEIYHPLIEHLRISKNAKFGCEMP